MKSAALGALLMGSMESWAARQVSKKQITGVVNLNSATAQQLDLLPGVGAKAAKRIIDYRQKTPFAKLEELVKVKGFGKKKLEKLRPHLTVAGITTVQSRPSSAQAAPGGSLKSP
jgi:competence protein ComEA